MKKLCKIIGICVLALVAVQVVARLLEKYEIFPKNQYFITEWRPIINKGQQR